MALESVELDPELLARARLLTGLDSDQEIATLALEELVRRHERALEQKSAMVAGISRLKHLAAELETEIPYRVS